jgi:hypothetical protein
MRQVGRTRTRAYQPHATRDTSHMRRVAEPHAPSSSCGSLLEEGQDAEAEAEAEAEAKA